MKIGHNSGVFRISFFYPLISTILIFASPSAWPSRRFVPAGRGRRDSRKSACLSRFEELFFTLSSGYGLLLGALGLGAVVGAVVIRPFRDRFSSNALVVIMSSVYAVVLVILALAHNSIVVLIALLPAGMAWMAFLSTVNAALQLFLPTWVRARGLSMYLLVLFGAQALGAAVWGVVANSLGLEFSFLAAGIAMVVGGVTVTFWPFVDVTGMDRAPSNHWAELAGPSITDSWNRPVLVTIAYTISETNELAFIRTLNNLRSSRLRTGATGWGIFRDAEHPTHFLETFTVGSWEEHQRQHHDRLTGTDRDYEAMAEVLSEPAPSVSHFLASDIEE